MDLQRSCRSEGCQRVVWCPGGGCVRAQALSEFKRTHEQDSLDALRGMMSEDEWDRLQQATRSGSYFT